MIDRPRIVKTNDIAAYQLSVDALERWAELAEKENKELKKELGKAIDAINELNTTWKH